MEKVLDFAKSKKGMIIIGSVLVLIIAIILVFVFSNKKITKLEQIRIEEFNDNYSNYLDEIYLNEKDEGRYINFAVEYLYNKTGEKEIKIGKILEVINDTFDINYDEMKIEKIGITESMLNKGLVYDSGKRVFKYNSNRTGADLAHTSIIKYNLKKITKKSNEKFVLEYEKYLVDDPYKVLNYYSNDADNTKEITEYLKGNSKISVIKDKITSKNIKKVGKIEGKTKITLVIKNNKLLIK